MAVRNVPVVFHVHHRVVLFQPKHSGLVYSSVQYGILMLTFPIGITFMIPIKTMVI